MFVLENISKKIESINIENYLYEFFDLQKTKNYMVRSIRKRLFQDGIIDKDGNPVETNTGSPYAELTKKLKTAGVTNRDGKRIYTGVRPTDRVTLYSEGHLYASFFSVARKTGFEILAKFKDAKYGEGIYRNFTDTFASEQDFFDAVMELSYDELADLFNEFLDFLHTKI